MATILRLPLITRIERANPSAAANAQPWRGSNIALLTAVVVVSQPPFSPLWPNPTPVRWPNDLRTWFNFQTTPITTPATGFDFINTRSATPPQQPYVTPNVTLRSTLPPSIPPGVLGSYDQPNPQRPDRFRVFRFPQFPNFKVLPQPNTKPFFNAEWPVPRGPVYSITFRTFLGTMDITSRLPPPGTATSMNTLSISILASHRIGF